MRNIILADNQDVTKAGCQYILHRTFGIDEFDEATEKNELLGLIAKQPQSFLIFEV